MKVTNSFEKINPFGGINFILDEARKCGIPQLIDSLLGERGKGYTYKYSDIFIYDVVYFLLWRRLCRGYKHTFW